MDNRLLARLARQHGGRLLDLVVGKALPDAPAAKTSIAGKIAGAALLRIATRSVPGAIVVTGGLLAKRAHDRRKARRAASKGAGKGDSGSASS